MALSRACFGGSSSSLGLSLSHDVTQSQIPSGTCHLSKVPALVLVLQVLSQDDVLLEGFATRQAVYFACCAQVNSA